MKKYIIIPQSVTKYSTKVAFTLAEILITLAIIGVVAALTIPTLITTNQEKGWNTAATVFERKLEESLKVMNSQGTLAGYRNTKDFVTELSKHLKIIKICDNNDLMSCFEDKVMWGSGDATPEEIDMTPIKTAAQFGQNDWKTNLVGIQLANGTSGLIAYNPDCKQDMFSNQITGTSCLALLYDTSGFAKPNTSGKDLRSINVTKLGSSCAFEIGGTCYGTPFYPTPMSYADCAGENATSANTTTAAGKEASALGIKQCYYENDYWAGAVKACGGVNKMPTQTQLTEIAQYIYPSISVNSSGATFCPTDSSGSYINCRDDNRASSLGFAVTSGNAFFIWSRKEDTTSYGAYDYGFYTDRSFWGIDGRYGINDRLVVCIED